MVSSLSYLREHPEDNPYARPIEGVLAYVDLVAARVTKVVDTGVVPIPKDPGRYDSPAAGMRTDLKPIAITQPEGPSFTVDGWELRWQRWRMRISFNAREGLVLHTIGYEDGERVRPILYRAGLSEMVVPYGDVSPAHFYQGAFDAGDYGVGKGVNALELGCDCLGEIRYLDVTLFDDSGEPVHMPKAICIHEEDFGILWKHFDFPQGGRQTRRSRRLVVSSISTLLNYEYGFFWYFYLDGTIEFQVKLTGIVQTAAVEPGREPRHAELVGPGLWALPPQPPFHRPPGRAVDGPGHPVPPGGEGGLVRTGPTRRASPSVRYRTRDRVVLVEEPCACGSPFRRISKLRGRTDDMLIVRGVNVFPSMVEEILLSIAGLTGNYQIVVDRTQKHHDAMQVLVEAEPETNKEALSIAAQERIKEMIGLTVEVTVLAGGVLPRSEGKAKRVIDRRELNG